MTPDQDPLLQIIPLWTESDTRLEIVFNGKNAFELNDDAVTDLWPLLNQLLEKSEPKELSIRFNVVGSGATFNRIIGGVLSSKPSIPTRIWFQESTVTSRFLLAYQGNVTEFKASDAIFSGGGRHTS